MPFTTLSLNANGLNHPAKHHSLWRTATALHSDILCVQETHLLPTSISLCKHNKFPHIFHAPHCSKTRGVMIAIRDTVDFQLIDPFSDPKGRFIILVSNISRTPYTLINLYAPNSHLPPFLQKVIRKVSSIRKGHLVVCGDFNLVSDIYVDSTSAAKRRDSPLKRFLPTDEL